MVSQNTKEALQDETNKLVDSIIKQGVDVITGGFPCQDISAANQSGQGVDGERSGLVWAMLRTVRLVRPKYVVLENVPNILRRGVQRIFGRLASIGYDIEWDSISAASAGAPHKRERVYMVAYDRGAGRPRLFTKKIQRQPEFSWCKDVRRIEDLRGRPDIPEPLIRGAGNGARQRLHGIGNGNPPCIFREIMKDLKND